MPLTEKGEKILASMKKEYGEKKGEEVFYASANSGTITGVHDEESSGPSMTPAEYNEAARKRHSEAADTYDEDA